MDVTSWLLDGDPSIRWQVMRDLLDAPADQVKAERARVAREGWGARLLELQGDDGLWDGGTFWPAWAHTDQPRHQPWSATYPTLVLLRLLGVDPDDAAVQAAIDRVAEAARWEYDGSRFFDGEVEPCINAGTVAIGTYFGRDVTGIVERLLGEQMADGGWNCEQENGSVRGSFDTTIGVLEALLEHERAAGATPATAAARERGEEYLLERHLLRRLSTGEVVDAEYSRFSFPTRWHYDALRALDYFRSASRAPDARCAEALALVDNSRSDDGRWPLHRVWAGAVPFELEPEGEPSRWITLRALRVLRWGSGV